MAIFRWRGTQDTTWDDGRNWVNEDATAYAEARYPGSAAGEIDDVIFDAAVTNSLVAYDLATAGQDLRSLKVGALYDGTIAVGGYLDIEVTDEVTIEASAAGEINLEGGGTNGLNNVVVLDGTDITFNGKLTNPTFLKGTIACAASSTIATSLTIGYLTSQTSDVTLTLGASMTLPTTINCGGGTVDCSTAVTTLNVNGGTWTQTAGNVTTLRVTSGTCAWNAGHITTAYVVGGTLDASGAQVDRRITDLYLYPAGASDLDDGVGNVHVIGRIYHMGGTLTLAADSHIMPYVTESYTDNAAEAALSGIDTQVLNNSNVTGDWVYVGEYDKLDCYCICGGIAAGGAVTMKLQEASDVAGTGAADIAGKTNAWGDGDDNKATRLSAWGYELTSSKRWVACYAVETGTQNATVTAIYCKKTGV